MTSISDYHIRPACKSDRDVLADFNRRLAAESEQKQLDLPTLTAGVEAILNDASKGRYFVACVGEVVVGQMLVTHEWSDWRNGDLWWLQSVYVTSDHRRRGVFRRLYKYVWSAAAADPQVAGIRLYVEEENQAALATYRGLGLNDTGYRVMEHLFR